MWYSEVSRNISRIPDAVAYFESELLDAKKEVKLTGNGQKREIGKKFRQIGKGFCLWHG